MLNIVCQQLPRFSCQAVLRIHDILVCIGIRIWIRGSMPLINGSGSGSGSYYLRHYAPRRQQKLFKRIGNTAAKWPKTFCPRKHNFLLPSLRIPSSVALIFNSLLFIVTYSKCVSKTNIFFETANIWGGTFIPRILSVRRTKDLLPAR